MSEENRRGQASESNSAAADGAHSARLPVLDGPEGLTVDRLSRRAFVADREVTLTKQAFDLLAVLLENQGRVVSIEELASSVWRHSAVVDHHFMQTALYRLRLALRDAGLDPTVIEAVRGVGYVIGRRPESNQFKTQPALEAAILSSTIPTLIVDRSPQIVLANPAIGLKLGYSAEELERLPHGTLTPAGLRDSRRQLLQRVFNGEQVLRRNTEMERRNGSIWLADAFGGPLIVNSRILGALVQFWQPAVSGASAVIG